MATLEIHFFIEAPVDKSGLLSTIERNDPTTLALTPIHQRKLLRPLEKASGLRIVETGTGFANSAPYTHLPPQHRLPDRHTIAMLRLSTQGPSHDVTG
jgi:hypothetical protein